MVPGSQAWCGVVKTQAICLKYLQLSTYLKKLNEFSFQENFTHNINRKNFNKILTNFITADEDQLLQLLKSWTMAKYEQ